MLLLFYYGLKYIYNFSAVCMSCIISTRPSKPAVSVYILLFHQFIDFNSCVLNSNLMEISSTQELTNNYMRVFYSKRGQTISLYIEQNKAKLSYNTAYKLGTLPNGYCPLRSFANMVALGRDTPVMAYLSVGSGGDVTLRPYGDLPVEGYTYCYITFVCK